jgi:hypothetical protein
MLLGLVDYLNYRRKRGRYSQSSIGRVGLRPATAWNFTPSQLVPGDLIFLHPVDSSLSWFIMYATNSPVSHMAMSVGSGEIIDATFAGVQVSPFAQLLDGKSYLSIVRLDLSDEQRGQIRELLSQVIGKPYGWGMALRQGFMQVIGKSDRPNVRLYVDVVLTLAAASSGIRGFSGKAAKLSATLGGIYLTAVLANRVRVWQRGKVSANDPDGDDGNENLTGLSDWASLLRAAQHNQP